MAKENPLHISWHDTNFLPFLNGSNVLDYFSDKSNSFYDRTCNNEQVKMQRQSMDNLKNMVGTEYILLHVKEPILYVVRKQHRHSPEETTPLTDYYIIAGRVYQAPDLGNVFNSRLLSTVHHLQQAFDEANSFARYHPQKGYSWDFSSTKAVTEEKKEVKKEKPKEEPSSYFQRQRVDILLGELLRKFPVPQIAPEPNKPEEDKNSTSNKADANKNDPSKVTIKQEPVDEVVSNNNSTATVPNVQIKQEPSEKKMKMG
ncbi:mediator of RNA polymerase II transcription subunit 6 [Chironomus tepperi]|uniref:mediator of RNA polymerase II transcription subunit 6 n=1 Tax=Chironomus tepperi TaxID=113505 RepID=UPI00391F837F